MSKFQSLSKVLWFLPLIFLSSCAFGPLFNQESARTVGGGNHEFVVAGGQGGFALKWNYGVNEDLDLGLHLEMLSAGIRGKYAFFQSDANGWSLAAALGVGSSAGGNHQYADLTTSYIFNDWEPYGTFRLVHVSQDPVEFKQQSTNNVIYTTNQYDFGYAHIFLGSRYWFSKRWQATLEVSTLSSLNNELVFKDVVIGNLGLGYRF